MALMEIINDQDLGFKQIIEKENFKNETGSFEYEDIENLAGSPALKRGIWQTLQVIEEIKNYMGNNHKKKNKKFVILFLWCPAPPPLRAPPRKPGT